MDIDNLQQTLLTGTVEKHTYKGRTYIHTKEDHYVIT